MLLFEQTEGIANLSADAPNATDQELIAAANRGEVRAFEQLYERYRQ